MSGAKTWGEERFAQILKDARSKYGSGWEHLSDDQRKCFIDSRILALVMGQDGEKFAPAQTLVQQVLAAANPAPEETAAASVAAPVDLDLLRRRFRRACDRHLFHRAGKTAHTADPLEMSEAQRHLVESVALLDVDTAAALKNWADAVGVDASSARHDLEADLFNAQQYLMREPMDMVMVRCRFQSSCDRFVFSRMDKGRGLATIAELADAERHLLACAALWATNPGEAETSWSKAINDKTGSVRQDLVNAYAYLQHKNSQDADTDSSERPQAPRQRI